jgi:hypothetical protein
MNPRNDREVDIGAPGNPTLGQSISLISSLNEAWFHALNNCVVGMSLSELIFPLMRNAFCLSDVCVPFAARG